MLKTTTYDIPNWNDFNQWLPGGQLKNESYMGGYLFNPTYPIAPDEKPKLNTEFNILNGRFENELNTGYTQLKQDIKQGEYFNLFNDTHTVMYEISVTIESIDGTTETISDVLTGDVDLLQQSMGTFNKTTDLQQLTSILSAKGVNLFTGSIQNLAISIAISNLYDGKTFETDKMSFQNFIGSSALGSIHSLATNNLTSALVTNLGISSVVSGIIVKQLISNVLTEVFEYAVGYDNKLGFGGQYIGTDALGQAVYGKSISTLTGIKDSLLEMATLGFADTYTFNNYKSDPFGTDINGNIVANFSSNVFDNKWITNDYYNDPIYGEGLLDSSSVSLEDISTLGGFKELERQMNLDGIRTGNTNIYGGYDSFDDAYADYFGEFENDSDGDGIDDDLGNGGSLF